MSVFFLHGSAISTYEKVKWWLGGNQGMNQDESQSFIEQGEVELPTISEPQEQQLEEDITRFLSAPKYQNLLAASDDLISTYHVAIQPHRDSMDTKTIWVSLFKYTEKFAKYTGGLINLDRSEFDIFRESEKYQYIVNLNHIIETMIVSLIRSYEPKQSEELDLFLSHAGEQKEETVKPLRDQLSSDFCCFYDAESLKDGDYISDEIRDALLSCNVGMVLISKDFVQKRWPMLELFILSARAVYHGEDDFKLVVATLCSTMEDTVLYSKGWDGWFDCVHKLPLPWPSKGMPVAMKLTDNGSSGGLQRLSEALTSSVEFLQAKKKLKKVKRRFLFFVPLLLISLILLSRSDPIVPFADEGGKVSESRHDSDKGHDITSKLFVGKFHVREAVPYFQGREEEMNQLTEMLKSKKSVTVVPHGIGGIGKSQLVTAWVNKNSSRYGAILWLRAEHELTLIDDLVSYAYATRLSSLLDSDNKVEIAKRVIRVIAAHRENEKPILIVYDNAESYEAVRSWLPAVGSDCQIVITTRDSAGLEEDSLLTLGPLDRESSIRIVEHFVKGSIKRDERKKMLSIFESFDFLPLAIVAFASRAKKIGVSRTIEEFKERREEALDERLNLARTFEGDNRESVWIVLRMQLESLCHEAMVVLENLSVVDAERVPVWLLDSAMPRNQVNIALEDLQEKAVIQYDTDHELISTHRLLQDSAFYSMSNVTRMVVMNWVGLELLIKMRSIDMMSGWNETMKVMPHALAIVDRPWLTGSDLELLGELYIYLGNANLYAEKFENAKRLYNKALPILKERLGDKHLLVAIALNNMGSVFDHEGLHDKALEYYDQALPVIAAKGKEQPKMAQLLNNMAMASYRQGLYDKAHDLYKQALSIEIASLGYNHSLTATTLNNIGLVYEKQELYDKALEKYEEALSIERGSLGDKHPLVARTYHNMAAVYDKQGRYDMALELYRQALSIQSAAFGDECLSISITLARMAEVYAKQGSDDMAFKSYQQALSIKKKALGDDYPSVAAFFNYLAVKYWNQGLHKKALETLNAALIIEQERWQESVSQQSS